MYVYGRVWRMLSGDLVGRERKEEKRNLATGKGRLEKWVRGLSLGTNGPREYDQMCLGWRSEGASR